jgi:tetratricopeptide (TPR) repeat protein
LHLQRGEFESAEDDANLLVWSRENSPAGYAVRGLSLFSRGLLEACLADFDKLIAIRPKLPIGWLARGAARLRTGRLSESVDDLKRALSLSPGHRAAGEELAHAFDRARQTIEGVTPIDQSNGDAYDVLVQRGDLYYLIGEYSNAMQDYQDALKLGDTSAETLFKLNLTQRKLRGKGRSSARLGGKGASVEKRGQTGTNVESAGRRPRASLSSWWARVLR